MYTLQQHKHSMRFAHSNALAAIISYIVVVRSESETTAFDSDSLVPIAMITHYSDTECSTLDVKSDFQGYYRNPDAEPGTAEANFTYFCDPAKLSSHASAFGIHNLDSCYVNNGGNWYFQPLGFCAAFVINNETMSVQFTSIDHTNRTTIHSVYSDLDCTVPKIVAASAISGACFDNDPKGKNGTSKAEAGFFSDIGSYQVIIPDSYNYLGSSTTTSDAATACRIPSVLVSFVGLSLFVLLAVGI